MADVKSAVDPSFLREEELRRAIEMLFFAYRDFTGEPDAMLAGIGLGRAHHRAIYFVGRNPDITVTQLLGILKITKQSLSRVLSQLVRDGYIEQHMAVDDRRKRLLRLTETGVELERALTAQQRKRIQAAYKIAGVQAVQGFKDVLRGIMDSSDRWRFETGDAIGERSTASVTGSPSSRDAGS